MNNEGCDIIGEDEDNLYYVSDSGEKFYVNKKENDLPDGWRVEHDGNNMRRVR